MSHESMRPVDWEVYEERIVPLRGNNFDQPFSYDVLVTFSKKPDKSAFRAKVKESQNVSVQIYGHDCGTVYLSPYIVGEGKSPAGAWFGLQGLIDIEVVQRVGGKALGILSGDDAQRLIHILDAIHTQRESGFDGKLDY